MFTLGPARRKNVLNLPSLDYFYDNVQTLINFESGLTDVTGLSTLSSSGSTGIVTSPVKFGSQAWTGASARYFQSDNSNLSLTGDFTFELFTQNGGMSAVLVYLTNVGGFYMYNGSFTGPNLTIDYDMTTYGHLAICREGTTLRSYKNGTQTSSITYSSTIDMTGLRFGMYVPNGNLYYTGTYDSIRITKGICRYPGGTTFTPTAVDYPTVGYTSLVQFYENDNTTLSNGNTTATFTSAGSIFEAAQLSDGAGANTSTSTTKTGKEYVEFTIGGDSTGTYIGIFANTQSTGGYPGNATNPFGTSGCYAITNINYNGGVTGLFTNGSNTSNASYDYTIGDVIGMAIDWDAKKIWYRKASSGWISGDPVAGTSPTFTFTDAASTIYVGSYARNSFTYTVTLNKAFKYTPPAGFGRTIHAGSTA